MQNRIIPKLRSFNYHRVIGLFVLSLFGIGLYHFHSQYSEIPEPVFDLSQLKGKNIEQVNELFGEPTYFVDPFSGSNEVLNPYYYNHYNKNNTELMIRYEPDSGKILEITLTSQREYWGLKRIMHLGNLDPNNLDGFYIENRDPWPEDLHNGFTIVPNDN